MDIKEEKAISDVAVSPLKYVNFVWSFVNLYGGEEICYFQIR